MPTVFTIRTLDVLTGLLVTNTVSINAFVPRSAPNVFARLFDQNAFTVLASSVEGALEWA